MKKIVLCLLIAFLPLASPQKSDASGLPVVDVAAISQAIEQIKKTMEMIKQLNTLTDYAELDHLNLAGKKFAKFLTQYKKLFNEVMSEIEGYQAGGLMGQIDRLDEVYFPYHENWDNQEENEQAIEADPLYSKIAKQILWTRIQFKHAAKVGAKIRDSLPQTQAQIDGFLDDTAQAVGIMQSIKIGNELTGTVAKSLQTLNISLTEQLQAQAALGLEQNHKEGLKMNRAREAIKDWGKDTHSGPVASRNPFEKF